MEKRGAQISGRGSGIRGRIRRPMLSRKAQLSIFIAMGLVVVMSTGIFFYIQAETAKFLPEEIVPAEILPVREYTKSCIADLSLNAITLMGQQGGYINVPRKILDRRDASVALFEGTDVKLPMWYYGGKRQNPSIDVMAKEIENYVRANSEYCFDYAPFQEKFEFENASDASVKVTVTEEDVVIDVQRGFKVKDRARGRETEMTQYLVQLPIRLKKVVEIGEKIVDSENQNTYFEKLTVEMMASNEKIPFTNMEFDCGKKTWVLSEIQAELQQRLYEYMPGIRVKNTGYPTFEKPESYYEDFSEKYHGANIGDWQAHQDRIEQISKQLDVADPPQDIVDWTNNMENIDNTEKEIASSKEGAPEDIFEYFHMFWDMDITEDDAGEDIKVGFAYYPQTDMFIRAYPSQGGLLKSNTGKGPQKYLSFMCINVYHFTYDVNYPVEVRIYDSQSLNGRGYEMRFAMPVIIKKNEASRKTTGYLPYYGPEYDYDFCSDKVKDELLEEKEYKITVKDKNDLTYEIPKANITFLCINYECPLGITGIDEEKYDEGYVNYNLKTGLPAGCQNGFVVADKEGYLGDKEQISTNEPGSAMELRMREIKKIPFTVQRNIFINPGNNLPWEINADSDELDTLNRQSASMYYTLDEPDTGFFVTRDFPYSTMTVNVNGTPVNRTMDYIELPLDTQMTYDLNIMLKNKKGDVIGGYMAPWTVSYDQIAGAKRIIFHVIEYRPTPANDEQKMAMYTVLATNEQYKAQLMPEIIYE